VPNTANVSIRISCVVLCFSYVFVFAPILVSDQILYACLCVLITFLSAACGFLRGHADPGYGSTAVLQSSVGLLVPSSCQSGLIASRIPVLAFLDAGSATVGFYFQQLC
jgi:hypothetical protein